MKASKMCSESLITDFSQRYGYLDAFEVEQKMIGKGQFSEVHRATCKEDGEKVALKRIKVGIAYFLFCFFQGSRDFWMCC